MSSEKFKNKIYTVSVCIIAYNHEKYIEKCILSVLEQKTDFDFEIIIHDDASNDGTVKIINDIIKHSKQNIKLIAQKYNTYKTNKHSPLLNVAKAATADYIAICEGDDYWVNPNKLIQQLQLMRLHPYAALAVSPGLIEINGVISRKKHCYHGPKVKIFNAQDVVNKNGQFAPTASYFCKKNILIDSLNYFKGAPIGDLFIEIYAGENGGIIYQPIFSSVYRVLSSSSWSSTIASGNIKFIENYVEDMEHMMSIKGANTMINNIDWSKKRAYIYYNLAVTYYKNNNFINFKRAIEKSVCTRIVSIKQLILYYLRFFKFLTRMVNGKGAS